MKGKPRKSVGVIETQFFDHPGRFALASGAELENFTLAYETYGELSAERDNAILVFHALSGSQHAAGSNTEVAGLDGRWTAECHEGWWDKFIGPGKALDTDRFFVICANYLGGCYGSTGPASNHPVDGKPYGSRFPRVALSDIVRSQLALLDFLQIGRLHAAVGASVGGLLALQLATDHPSRVHNVIPIASAMATSLLQHLLNFEQITAIESDPNFRAGDYYEGAHPDAGLALARRISHKTFVSIETIEQRARREVSQPGEHLSWYEPHLSLESYMLHQGDKFVQRFDANTYLRIVDAWQRFDLVGARGGTDAQVFEACGDQHYLVFTIDSDVCFYPDQQARLKQALEVAGVSNMHITVHSSKGHDSFLLEPELFTPHLTYALRMWL